MTLDDMKVQMRPFGARRYFEVEKVIQPLRFYGIGVRILVAVGSRESGLTNINGFDGDGAGVFQISRTYHSAWLRTVPGCAAGTFDVVTGATAADDGMVPTLADGARKAMEILSLCDLEAARLKLTGRKRIEFVLASYNAGVASVSSAYKNGQPLDTPTAGGNYSTDVMARWDLVSKVCADWAWV